MLAEAPVMLVRTWMFPVRIVPPSTGLQPGGVPPENVAGGSCSVPEQKEIWKTSEQLGEQESELSST
jgi:hypothetical protein